MTEMEPRRLALRGLVFLRLDAVAGIIPLETAREKEDELLEALENGTLTLTRLTEIVHREAERE